MSTEARREFRESVKADEERGNVKQISFQIPAALHQAMMLEKVKSGRTQRQIITEALVKELGKTY